MCISKFKFGYFSALSLLLMTLSAAPARAGIEANNFSLQNDISANGRFVVFESIANNLVPGDTNGNNDIFFLNRASGVITRLSVNNSGVQGNNPSVSPKITPDGRYVVFSSIASNFATDTNGVSDIFLRDMQTNTISLISVATGGTQGNNGSFDAAVSDDGRYVVFQSSASNLVAGDTNGVTDTFVRDTVSLTTTRVSVSSAGIEGNGGTSFSGISADGSHVVFISTASNLVAGDTNGFVDIFVRNTLTNTTQRVSLNNSGAQVSGDSGAPAISGNDRYIAFTSSATDVVAGDTNGTDDIFVRDTQLNTTVRVSVSSAGVQANNASQQPTISGNGQYVSFASSADNLVGSDTNSDADVFRRDLQSNTTARVSMSSSGAQSNGFSDFAKISDDGRYIVFRSIASNLGAGDTNTAPDTFVRDNLTLTTTRVNVLPDTVANLQALYQCDANALDSSGGLRHLGPSFGALNFAANGRFDRACQFDGFTRVKSANGAFTQSNAVTYAYWIKKTTPRTGQETIMQTVTGAGTSNVQNSIDFETSSARQRFWSNNATFPFTISTVPGPTLFDSTWHHVAITSTGPSSSVQIYIDGAAVTPVTLLGSNNVADLATTFYLGARSDLLSNDLAVYQGAMDDVRIYSRVLTPFDVLDLTARPGIGDVADVTINEDTATAALSFLVNDLQTPAAALQVVASSSNPTLVPLPNITLGGTGNARTVSVMPAPNQSGTSTITLTVTDDDFRSSNVNFILTVNPVNDAPTFTPGANQSGLEDAGPQSITNWATAIDDGDPETVQTLNFVVTPFSSVGLTFSVLPSISPSGTLSYTTAPNSNGSATFSVRLDDNGGTANGGVNQSTSQTFNISAGPVNDAPTFTAGANQSVLEDAGPQSIANWATAINTNDLGVFQAVNFVVTPISGTVNFSIFPTISPTGTLSYTSAPNSVGSATFSVQLFDDGGTANGGVNQSSVQNFTISVGPVNDAPTFIAGANQSVLEDAGPQSISNWATALDDGDPETVQALNFVVTPISGTVNFSVFPTISPTGTLSYTSAPNSNGSATFSVQLFDNGGTANGGVNQSAVQNFTISVGPVNDAPTISALSNLSTNEDTATAAIAIIVGDTESAPSTLTLSATSSNLSLLPVGNVVFGGTGANRTAVITPAPDQSGTAIITVTVSDGTDTASQSFSLSVTPVNDPPSFTAGVNQSLLFANNSPQNISNWATAITDGDPDFVQTLSFNVSNSNNALFSVQPSIAANGTLSFTATGAPGTAIVSVSLTDDATAGGPALSTPSITFSITVAANTLPSLSAISAQSTNEDTAAAIAFTVSDIETPASALVVTALSSNTTLIPLANIVLSGTGSNRSLSITPAANRSGTSTITLNLSDGTGSSSRNFVLTVNPINDLPSFIKGTNQVIAPGITGAQSISNWASAIDDGDADFTQALSFNLSSDNPSLFTSQPSVSAAGTLSFTPAGIAGIATVSISLTDDASAGGGALTTAVQSFTITIQAVPIVSVEQRTPTSTVVGQPFTVRVRVRNPTGSLVPTGTVSVTPLPVGTTVQCSLTTIATPPGSAEALCTNVISPIASAKLVLAVYDGNPVFLAAEASDTHAVDKAATQLRILEDLPDPSPSNTPVAVRYQLEVLAPSVAPLSSLNGIITLSDGINQTSAPFSLSNPVISLVMQGDGSRVLTLRYSSDSNFLDSTATEAHTLTGGNSTDLAVTVSNGKRYVQSGGEAIYLIRVRNLGGINSSAQLNAFVPEELSNYRYTCTASADSSCHALNGTGAIIAAINVAAGGEVTYTVRADVTATEPASITHSARIVPAAMPPDTNASNDVASDTDFVALYLDGFED